MKTHVEFTINWLYIAQSIGWTLLGAFLVVAVFVIIYSRKS